MKYMLIVLVSIIFSETLVAQEQLKKECFEAEINTENQYRPKRFKKEKVFL